ncbi:DeoR/GlpR family DNA-binding transcription regulator [Lactiplantibacillus paraplantarum]|uniref:DeoR/GlpR family DNA-binding transcription regulator n=1 Tax=Lactiplantibacillus paraplantarum TaxID=60520 RepID=UPI0005144AB3|nr:DeoR/GlpR family DNA-binding transcription regulator [Lactiplantibacillus paraplantarum]OAX74800.1 DeoR family transcriptional regulator [Lactiplantibacillus plantarum]ALO04844.1 DeoR family transcriptional regulator [Lactiplantibacillus paraplantarum]KGE74253.1 DeoR faimly transcriptional regulator [Lactiplantibacillus paraplantarum]MCT4457359.1 DeoR/GlpR transcriptional regulator [Lactiplantibacillus paraplantarum]MCW1910947.1 DeoR/GlpR family DNA-binding transcription regulator [Lactipla
MNQRNEQLLEIVNQRKKIEVNELATLLNVSKVTIRKDLTELENRGLLQRQHGFAMINNPNNLNFRLAQNYDVKRRIAQLAATIVHDNDTIMIESGSTCALLAEELGKSGKHITIITISYFIANYIREYDNLTVYVLGGQYQSDAQVGVGPLTKLMLANFHTTKLFLGVDGFDENYGFYGNDIMRADTVQAMAVNADKAYVLTDASKFKTTSTVRQLAFHQVYAVITDDQLSTTNHQVLVDHQLHVRIVTQNESAPASD